MRNPIRIESKKKNVILIVEVLVCFGPVTALLLIGIGLWVVAAYYIVTGQSSNQLSLYIAFLLVFIIGGLLGIASLISLLIVIMDKGNGFLSPFKTRLYMTIGIFSILAFILYPLPGIVPTVLLVVLPLLSAGHIYWMGKEKLSIIENSSRIRKGEM